MSGRGRVRVVLLGALAASPLLAALDLTPILRPSLDGVEPAVAELLTERLEALEARLDAPEVSAAEAAEELGSLGRLYLAYSLPEAAESCLVNAVRLAPSEPDWHYLLGTIRQERGDLEAARSAFRAARELDPENPALAARLAQVAFDLGEQETARTLYSGLLDRPGFGAVANYGLGRIAASKGDLGAAVGRFEAALAEQPAASQVRYQLGIAHRRLGEMERARELLADRGRDLLTFPDPLLESLGQDVSGVEVLLTTGRKARQRGDLETATQAFRAAVEAEPDEVEHRTILGAILLEAGRVEESVEVYESALRLDPDDQSALYNLALAEERLGRVAEAMDHLTRLRELAPDHVDGRVNLAILYEQTGRLQDAESELAAAIELDPYQPGLRVHRASILTSLGRPAEARRVLQQVLSEHPGDAEALVVLGIANDALGSSGDALAAWQRAVEVAATQADAARAHYFLGRAHLQSGRAELARTHLAKATEAAPGNPDYRLLLAGALGAQGDFAGSAREYGGVLEARPGDRQAQLGRALSLLLGGREVEARADLERWLTAAADVSLKHLLARILATAVDPAARDGERAVVLAEEVFEVAPSLEHAETVAMAYAEAGRFDAALEWQARIIERARATGRSDRLSELEGRRAQFERSEPVRAPWSSGP